jgi:hypothetical protein
VRRGRRHVGVLEDVVVAAGGSLAAIVVGGRELPFDESVQFEPEGRSLAVS